MLCAPAYTQVSPLPPSATGSVRFQLAGRNVIRKRLRTSLAEAPTDKRILCRLGSLAAQDGNIEDAVDFLRQAAKVACVYCTYIYLPLAANVSRGNQQIHRRPSPVCARRASFQYLHPATCIPIVTWPQQHVH